MPGFVPLRPTVEEVSKTIQQFDEENRYIEWLLSLLFAEFPKNTDSSQVWLKVKILNLLYSTRIQGVDKICDHIISLIDIDSQIGGGSPNAVESIARINFNEKQRYNISFASKYCSWHNPEAYPIYDSRADACLWHYEKLDQFAHYHRNANYDYAEYVRIVTAFRDRYGLEEFTFKNLDKFLFLTGENILANKIPKVPEDGVEHLDRSSVSS